MKQKDFLLLALSSFFVIIVWIGFSIYQSFFLSTISAPTLQKIIPIQPDFNQALINKIKERSSIEPLYQVEVSSESAEIIPTEIPPAPETLPEEVTPSPQPPVEIPQGATEEPIITSSPGENP